ncbi:Serine/threonine protein kinase (fragment), partial [Chondrus crispus]
TSSGALLAALDVHSVRRTGRDSVAVSGTAPREAVHLKLPGTGERWEAALRAAAARTPPTLADFDVVSPIGKGGGGSVFLVKAVGESLAMKVVLKCDAFYSDGSLRRALDERVVLQMVRGFPFVVQLRHAFQTATNFYMLTDFCRGGNLKTTLAKKDKGRMSESDARPIMAQIVLALEHVHSLNVMYRDLKPENVLLSEHGDARLCDFGLAKIIPTGRFGRTKSFCGSNSYMSPQIVSSKPYGIATDLWSLGVLFFRMLAGRAPFDDRPRGLATRNSPADIHRRIQFADVEWPSVLSPAAVEMLQGLLTRDESSRLNLQDLKESLFFEHVDWDEVLRNGYDRMAGAAPPASASAPAPASDNDELANFDADRLRSHGVALQDKELRHASARKPPRQHSSFVARQTSRLCAFSVRKRSEIARKPRSTSIVGFGFSTDNSSDPSGNFSRSDDTFSTSFGSSFNVKRS